MEKVAGGIDLQILPEEMGIPSMFAKKISPYNWYLSPYINIYKNMGMWLFWGYIAMALYISKPSVNIINNIWIHPYTYHGVG